MIGAKLKKLRGNKTQDDIAKILGISRARYSHYENNIREPDYVTLTKLADLYNVSVDYLLGRSQSSTILDEKEFEAFANDPTLEKWYKELPESKEEDLRKLRKMWEILKDNGEI